MKPLMYGYMKVASDTSDDELNRAELRMRCFADVEGFCYAATFFEYDNGSHAAFYELSHELRRAEAHHVIVPSLSHISAQPLLLNHMLQRLELDANAHVLTPGEQT
jgi:hypothetical protein